MLSFWAVCQIEFLEGIFSQPVPPKGYDELIPPLSKFRDRKVGLVAKADDIQGAGPKSLNV